MSTLDKNADPDFISSADFNPSLTLLYEATVTVGAREFLGNFPDGQRYIVPITGGTFIGPRLQGRVLSGGADRQRWRADGVKELDALYDMVLEDGTLLTIHNQVLIDEQVQQGPRYARSVVKIAAPQGPHAWLNRRVFVGTLRSLKPAQQAVLVSVYLLA